MNRLAAGFSPGHWRQAVHQARAARIKPNMQVRLRCREIEPADLDAVIDLLTIGFIHNRRRKYWVNALRRLSVRTVPAGYSQYGYMLESAGRPVGVILLIYAIVDGEIRCNQSSYYVEPGFRSFAPILMGRVHRHRQVTFTNISPARHTWEMLEAQGFRMLSRGIHVTVPFRCVSPSDVVLTTNLFDPRLSTYEIELFAQHGSYGCICVVCEHGGEVYPLIFVVRHYYGIPLAHLIYSRDQRDVVWLIGAVKGVLAKRGIFMVIFDANAPMDLPGAYFDLPKYYKGPTPPRLGDLTYSEIAIFGGF